MPAKISVSTVRATYCLAVLAAAASCHKKPGQSSGPVYDGFESPTLSDIWRTDKVESGAIEIQSEIVRAGKRAAKITIRQNDRFTPARVKGNRSLNANERDELTERTDLQTPEGQAVRYSFSIFIPPDFPVVPTRLVLSQWKQKDRDNTAKRDNPVIALRYENGRLSISTQTGETKATHYSTQDDIRGRWTDFVFDIRFSKKTDGFLYVHINGKTVLKFQGPTAYDESYGFPSDAPFYFKMGLYRDTMEAPMTACFDEYEKRTLTAAEIAAAIAPNP